MISPADHALFHDLCASGQRFALATHINPDGDALGSQMSLAAFLLAQGKQVRVVNNDATTDVLRFLEREEVRAEVYDPELHDEFLNSVDAVILVDNSAPDRLGRMEQVMLSVSENTFCIDHHPSRNAPWAKQILDEDACATAVLIDELTCECGWTPDLHAATALYVGLATDTGFFRFNSTNARGHELAAKLLKIGVESAPIYRKVYERNSLALTRLLGRALADVSTHADGAVASVRISLDLVDELDARDVDTSEITTALLVMDGIRIALLFRELDGGRVKVSLRSKGEMNVHLLASEFGGGGHRNASGIVMPGDIDDVIGIVTQRALNLVASCS